MSTRFLLGLLLSLAPACGTVGGGDGTVDGGDPAADAGDPGDADAAPDGCPQGTALATTETGAIEITYVERLPRTSRYCVEYAPDLTLHLCPGTEDLQRWPALGQQTTWVAHLTNRSSQAQAEEFSWRVDGALAASGTLPPLGPGESAVVELELPWSGCSDAIELRAGDSVLGVRADDLTVSIWVEQGLHDLFAADHASAGVTDDPVVGPTFEAWIQRQVDQMNERIAQAEYPATPDGGRSRLRIDKIVVAEELDGAGSPFHDDPDEMLIDGRWRFTDGDPTNQTGETGAWQAYHSTFVNSIDWGLIHELTHQLGIIDLYRLNLMNAPEQNNGIAVSDADGIIAAERLPTFAYAQILFQDPGLMGGGSRAPYPDGTYYSSHTAGGLARNHGHRRGYYGEYLFDTPVDNQLRVLDATGAPIAGAAVALYQKDGASEIFDDVPEITGTTDAAGRMALPNRPVIEFTTATGHSLRPNPFGQIHVVGTNGTMLVKVSSDGEDRYGWLMVLDLNLAYWSGATDQAVHDVRVVPLAP